MVPGDYVVCGFIVFVVVFGAVGIGHAWGLSRRGLRCPWRLCEYKIGDSHLVNLDKRPVAETCPVCERAIIWNYGDWKRLKVD